MTYVTANVMTYVTGGDITGDISHDICLSSRPGRRAVRLTKYTVMRKLISLVVDHDKRHDLCHRW